MVKNLIILVAGFIGIQFPGAQVLVNHVGYLADNAKILLVKQDGLTEAPVVTDNLNDWSLTYSHTANLTFDKSFPASFSGDTCRALRTTATKEEIVYRLDSLKSFEADIYYWPSEPVVPCSLFLSADGATWQPAAPLITGGAGNWLKYVYSLTGLTNVRFVKIRINNTSGMSWSPNISKVKLASWISDTVTAKHFVLQSRNNDTVFTGVLTSCGTDLGAYLQGDFSAFNRSGSYRALAGSQTSRWFYIGDSAKIVYQEALWKLAYNYPRKQRCGNTTVNYRGLACHLDDGKRTDNGQHQDASGGWHDACDLRKWMHATQSMMFGLLAVRQYGPSWDSTDALLNEMKWGSVYFRKMQDTAGFLYEYCGGDDGNYWSDNIIGTGDDRPLHVNRAAMIVHHQFIAHQAMLSRLTRDSDSAYAAQALAAALRCYHYSLTAWGVPGNFHTGSALMAGLALFKVTADSQYLAFATACAESLALLQETGLTGNQSEIRGYFYGNSAKTSMATMIYIEPLNLIALCELLESAPTHPDAATWSDILRSYCNDYLTPMTSRNAFKLVPFSLYKSATAGNRRLGDYYYRYFMPLSAWWVGINSNILGNAIVLYKTGRLLNKPEFRALAERQLDWVLGANPFDASSVTGVGANPIPFYVTSGFSPPTPQILGGVMNGVGGTMDDQPDLKPGSWQTAEYWTPHICHLEWLLSEMLSDSAPGGTTRSECSGIAVIRKGSINAQPNPFNPCTQIRYQLEQPGAVRYLLVDACGRVVREFNFTAHSQTGYINWDGRDRLGHELASGVYTGRLTIQGGWTLTHRLLLLR